DKGVRHDLACSHRYRANVFRDVGKSTEAREAYRQAIALHEQLLDGPPRDAPYRMALANTLINTATVFEGSADKRDRVYRRAVELNQDALAASPKNHYYQEELALSREAQALYYWSKGQRPEAEAGVRAALTLREALHKSGRMERTFERYLARSYTNL